MAIYFYSTKEEYGCFSNFSPHSVTLEDGEWPTVEHYFQAQKFADAEYRERIRRAGGGKQAKSLGRTRTLPIRADWDDARDGIMLAALRAKFTAHADIKTILLSTRDEELIEDAPTDYYWGCGRTRTGKNRLGQLLMQVRTELRRQMPVVSAETRAASEQMVSSFAETSNPFPGMNPYLEKPSLWPDVHNRYITYLADALNRVLPPMYVAHLDTRLSLDLQGYMLMPDDYLLNSPGDVQSGGTAVDILESDAPLLVNLTRHELPYEAYIEIVTTGDATRLVMVIELLSSANKAYGRVRETYRKNQRELLHSPVHLLEIDLLRAGNHTVASPEMDLLLRSSIWDYVVCLHRGGMAGTEFAVWPRTIRQLLPRLSLPLDAGVPNVPLDLQAVLEQTWQARAYARSLNYRSEPKPPLRENDAQWADTLLREKGLRETGTL